MILTHANHGFMNACRSCSEQALCVADVKRVNYTEKRCKCRVTYVRSQWFTAVTTSVSTRLDVLAVATTVDRAVPIQTYVPRTLRQGGLYLLAHPNLPIAALLLPQFPIIVAENYVLPANERVTDGVRTRDLRSHNPPTSVSRDCPALQNRFR